MKPKRRRATAAQRVGDKFAPLSTFSPAAAGTSAVITNHCRVHGRLVAKLQGSVSYWQFWQRCCRCSGVMVETYLGSRNIRPEQE